MILMMFVLAGHVASVTAHGYLAQPAARNVMRNSDYCPHCLTGPGVCGDPRGVHTHEKEGRVAAKYRKGQVIKAHVVITANHGGRWSLGLCASTREKASCFKKLRRADGGGVYVYLPASASSSSAKFHLPKGLACRRCVLRWLYETGNSCTPRGTPPKYANPHVQVCGTRGAPRMETFTNCADVSIV